jgi:putative salt-induced outer membrane protein YdiY
MEEHRYCRRWLVHVTIIAVLGTCLFQASHAAEPDTHELPVDTKNSSSSTGEHSGDDGGSGPGLAPPVGPTGGLIPEGDQADDEAARERRIWEDSVPPSDSAFDWIQLVSGEWLKGEFKTLYNYSIEFESDKLDILKLDWYDVRQLRTAQSQAVRIENLTADSEPFTAFGIVTMVDDKVTVGTGDNARTFDRDRIVSIVNAGQSERDFWTGNVTAGANIRSGNTDVTDMTLSVTIERRRAVSRLLAYYVGTYSRAEGVETSNNHRLDASFDALKSTQFYWRVLFGQYLRDTFRNIENQVSAGTGVGYFVIRTPITTWDVDAGVGVFYQQFVSVEADRPIDKASPVLLLKTRYEGEVTSWLDFVFDFALQIVDEDNGGYISHNIVSLETEITSSLELNLAWYWNHIEKPQPQADGTVPLQDDNRFVIGIAYDF